MVQTESSFTFEEVLKRMYILLLIKGISKLKVLSFAQIFKPRLDFNIYTIIQARKSPEERNLS